MIKETLDDIEKKVKVYYATGCDDLQICNAEIDLGVQFSEEYKEYTKLYGGISFGAHEFTGLNVDSYIDVVEATIAERELDEHFPKNCILIENCGIEGLLILQDNKGTIYEYTKANGCKKIYESLSEYWKACVK